MSSNTSIIKNNFIATNSSSPRLLDRMARRLLLAKLNQIKHGQLILIEGKHRVQYGNITDRCDINVTIHVNDPRFYGDVAFSGSIGAGEAYMRGYWHTSDLTNVIRLFLINREVLDNMERGSARVSIFLQQFLHWLNKNTLTGSRKNISAHYDIGNDFFQLMLDETMMYSCAIFTDASMSLYQAQINRLDIICQKLNLTAKDHLLEIGTGWGGLCLHAARHYGCKVTTTTISEQQYNAACERVKQAGLTDRITVLCKDYRELDGQFDKLVSIEMIEAVGYQFYDTYFKKCSDLLKNDGLMLLQAITISDQQYETAKKTVDFIQRYIFPGGCLPSNTAMQNSITRSSDLRVFDLTDIGPHYATTLNIWHHNVRHNIDKIKQLGYDEQFLRMWEFYLCYCEGGFIERAISTVHLVLAKPDNRSKAM